MTILYCILSFALGYYLATYLTTKYFKKKVKQNEKLAEAMKLATNTIAEKLNANNECFDEIKAERKKKYMEKQLKVKLKEEEDLKKLDKETLEKLKNIS
jgi:hypothetical protein